MAPGIALRRRNQESPRAIARHLPLPDLIEIAQQVFAPDGGVVQARFQRDQLVIDDVAQLPRAARPRLQIIPAALLRVVAEGSLVELIELHGDRRRQPRAGRFGQNAHAAVKRLVVARWASRNRRTEWMEMPVLPAAVRSAAIAVPIMFISCIRIGVDIRLDGVEPRRHEHARRGRSLLVHVVDDLRMPDVVQLRDGQPRFRLREDVPVAIVIVADILVIELRRRDAFVRRAQRLAIPVAHDVHAVGIERGHQDEDRVLEDRS